MKKKERIAQLERQVRELKGEIVALKALLDMERQARWPTCPRPWWKDTITYDTSTPLPPSPVVTCSVDPGLAEILTTFDGAWRALA